MNIENSPLKPNHTKPKVKVPIKAEIFDYTKNIVKSAHLNTVCEEAACPNIYECWQKKHATFIILGSVCTRDCWFCNIETGTPDPVDFDEPRRVAEAVNAMKLRHVVITSVDRDDLLDGGAGHFVDTINHIRKLSPKTTIEILTPDFLRKKQEDTLEPLVQAFPDVYNHNIETVPRLYSSIRPGARYFNSLSLLQTVKKLSPTIFTKSGVMVGLGETKEEVLQVMDDLRSADVDFFTVGQYLQPTPKHAPVDRYVGDEEFEFYKKMAYIKGFLMVSSSPLTRSSYHAEEDFFHLKAARENGHKNSN